MKCLLLATCAALVCLARGNLLGSEKCTWGPSYWCSHIHHAKECGAVQHCMTTIWKNQNLDAVKGSARSTFFQQTVSNMRHIMRTTHDEVEAAGLLAKACTILPGVQRQQCKNLLKNDLPEVMLMVNSQLDSKSVCAALGLCEGFQDTVPHPQPVQVTSTIVTDPKTYCADCKKFFGDIVEILSDNTTLAEFEKLIDNMLCSKLGPFENLCKQVVAEYVTLVLKFARSQIQPETLCELIGFCTDGDLEIALALRLKLKSFMKNLVKKSEGNGIGCELCKAAVTELRKLDREKIIQTDIENFLENEICARLSEFSKECKDYVKLYAPIVFELLANELDPETICKAVKFCETSMAKKHMDAGVQLSSPLGSVTVKKSGKVETGPLCAICEFVMKEVDQILGTNKTQAAIEAALEEVCSLLPATISTECNNFVHQYGPMIIQLLIQEVDPKEVCTALGLCSNVDVQVHKAVGDDETCTVCQTVVTYVINLLKENGTVQEMEKLLEKVCSLLPSEMKKECDSFVEEYGPAVIDLLIQELNAKEVCQELGLCPHKDKDNTLYFKKQMLGTDECTYGPSFWCASLKNARKCRVVEHCRKHVWKR